MSGTTSERTLAERITMFGSLLLIVGLMGLALWANMRGGDGAPVIEVQAHLEQVRQIGDAYYVPITITNSGGRTAQDATVTGELKTADGETETVDITIGFLASGEREEAEMIFTSAPADGEFSVHAISFVRP